MSLSSPESHPAASKKKPLRARLCYVTLEHQKNFKTTSTVLGIDFSALGGMETALRFAKAGQLILAVKYIESVNPWLTREQAKVVVNSFGYGNEFKWPEEQNFPLRCL